MICLTSTILGEETKEIEMDTAWLEGQISNLASGNREALGLIYDCINDSIYGYALSILGNTQDAEDILQECFLSLWKSAPTYKKMGKPMAWIFTITRNLCYMRIRKREKENLNMPENWEEYINGKENLSQEDRVVIGECIAGLAMEEKEILLLHVLGGLKHREIAELMEKPLSTILSKYNRTVKKLRENLREEN